MTFPRPPSLPANHRLGPHERQVYRLTAVLTHYKLETDNDYHLVLSDGSHTLIAEIPAPDCVGPSSPFFSDVRRARAAFDARFTATPSFLTANATATVLGVGFFDFIHGQSGVAPNGFELHPVTAICFGAGCVVDAERGDGGTPSNPGAPTGSHPGLNGCGCSLGISDQLLWPALAIAWARRKIASNRRPAEHPRPFS